MLPLLIFCGIGLVAFLIWQAVLAARRRREAFQAWADTHGWTYSPGHNRGLAQRFSFLDKLQHGHSRYGQDHFRGTWEGSQAEAFTFHYATTTTDSKGNTTTHHHYVGVVAFELATDFSELTIQPEGFLSKIAQFFGYDDVDFESVEFSKKFVVRSKEKKFAYDFCHTGMMELLLTRPKTALEVEGKTLALYDSGRLDPDEIQPCLEYLTQIREQMPEYLFRDERIL